MKLFFILALGRSGTNFLASLLAADPRTRVHHEAEPGDHKLLGLRYAGGFDSVLEGLLEERFTRLLGEAEDRGAEIYGEVNSFLRYESAWLEKRFQPTLIHLVRDGRDFVRSAFTRTVYTPWEEQQPVVPHDGDPYAQRWRNMPRFEQLCWYWQHTNEMLASQQLQIVQLEKLLRDYDYLSERVLEPTGVRISQQHWARAVSRPINTSEQNRLRRLLRLWILRRPRYQEVPPIPHWSDWDQETTDRFWEICGPTMEKMGYGTSDPRRERGG